MNLLNITPFDLNIKQQCATNNVRLSKLRTSMIKLMELTEKYICKSSLPATTASTEDTGLVPG
jgi:hypothetical protein